MSFEGYSLNGIADILPKTGQITNGELRVSFFANNLHGELGIAEICATMVHYAHIDAIL